MISVHTTDEGEQRETGITFHSESNWGFDENGDWHASNIKGYPSEVENSLLYTPWIQILREKGIVS